MSGFFSSRFSRKGIDGGGGGGGGGVAVPQRRSGDAGHPTSSQHHHHHHTNSNTSTNTTTTSASNPSSTIAGTQATTRPRKDSVRSKRDGVRSSFSAPSQKVSQAPPTPSSPVVVRSHRRHASVAQSIYPPPASAPVPAPASPSPAPLPPPPQSTAQESVSSATGPSHPKLPASPAVLVQRPATSHSSSSSPPSKKRAPARFSSNGIATASGPPPSLAYRRNIAMDHRFSQHTTGNQERGGTRTGAGGSTISHFSRGGSLNEGAREPPPRRNSLRTEREQGYGRGMGEDLQNGAAGSTDAAGSGGAGAGVGGLEGEPGTEDLFLNMARSGEAASGSENSKVFRNRTRLAHAHLAHHRSSLPADTFSSSPLRASQTYSPGNGGSSPVPPPSREEIWRDSRVSSPATRYRDRRMSGTTDSIDGQKVVTPRASFTRPASTLLRREHSPASSHTRSFSMAEPSVRPRSGLANGIAPRSLHSSPNATDQSFGSMMMDLDQTDSSGAASRIDNSGGASSGGGGQEDSSSVSTTAPSTVWDELDDLKSRIRRLELTGRMPASGAGAGGNTSSSSGERPRTATTTVTTISSSPRYQNTNGLSPANSTISHPPSNSHPLLQAALAKSKPVVPPEVYKYLEAAATDAVALANAVGSNGMPGAGPPAMIIDRQMRRKADSVCRSLTELCIALTENKASLTQSFQHHQAYLTSRPVSRDTSGGRESILGGRESILGGRESILGGRESMLGGRESVLGGRESVLGGRESVLGGRESILGRESSLGGYRGLSRLSERKGSIASISTAAGFMSSPRLQLNVEHQDRGGPTSPGHLRSRNSMLLKTRQPIDEDEDPESFRAPSRAATDIMGRHHHQQQREYQGIRHMSLTPERSPNADGGVSQYHHHRRHYGLSNPSPSPLPPLPGANRRFFSASIDRSDIDRASAGASSPFDLSTPANERLIAATAADADFASARYRSGSLGRSGTRRVARAFRESVDLDSSSSQQGGSLGRTPLTTGDRLLRR